MAVAFDVSDVVEVGDRLRFAANNAGATLSDAFDDWAEQVRDVMVDEMPEDEGTMKESTTIEKQGLLEATIGPTNTDEAGRPIGFFVNYGAGNRDPNDFIGRTAATAGDMTPDINLDGVL